MFGFGCTLVAGAAVAHGGGLNAEGCHTNRKTGEYHCHRGGGQNSLRTNPGSHYESAKSPSSFVKAPNSFAGPTCYTGPRGGTYTITASGRKNYGGC
ncbi:YHYH domain-containing protein [Cupriavidus oxalaticus]|uniref:YHYH domain-containing protein n=1 Tax=Cupriavidus oxalaticus TaxID=96344 RepID=A0A5P3VG09_9BURK|nr:YHYH domain-containing protein [Cupriavidus oxalaticus]QEZ44161.1 YHYH domain-containing protein [Cupriavidus oxalaticus]